MRSKAEFRAMRETLGITQQRLADDLGVKVLSIKRWESPGKQQSAPDDAWELLDSLMEAQDAAVAAAFAQVKAIEDKHGGMPKEIVLPYWASQQDYADFHYLAEDGDASWTEVNATNRRVALALRDLGYRIRWVDGVDNLVPRQD